MKPADVDASLRAAEPPAETLADGFSPPVTGPEDRAGDTAAAQPGPVELGAKSPF